MDELDLKKKLNPEQYRVMREKGAEYPYSGRFWDHEENGMYACAACGTGLFSSIDKFDSGTGFPSFYGPADAKNIVRTSLPSGSGLRDEVSCEKCGSHLGFTADEPAGKDRVYYRLNSASLEFQEMPELELPEEEEEEKKKEEEKNKEKEKGSVKKSGAPELIRTIVIMFIAAGAGAAMGAGYCSLQSGIPIGTVSIAPAATILEEDSPPATISPLEMTITPSATPMASLTPKPVGAATLAPKPSVSSSAPDAMENAASITPPPAGSASPAPVSPQLTPTPLPTLEPSPVVSDLTGSDGTPDGTK